MILEIFLLIVGFVLLIKGADMLIDGASSIAKRFKISDLVIGLTIVAMGTSMPEMIVNIFASISGSNDIAIGNILGSNIANIFLILGVSAMVYPLTVKRSTIFKEIPFSFLAAIVLALFANDILIDGAQTSLLSRIDGFILLLFFIIYMYYVFEVAKKNKKDIIATEEEQEEEIEIMSLTKSNLWIFLGIIGLFIGGKLIIDSAVYISKFFGISEAVIGLTVIAIGTSLPELVTSVIAALKRKSDLAIGNVVGSNIFNIFWILGLSAIIKPLYFNPASNIDLLMVIFSNILLFGLIISNKDKKINWIGGLSMFSIYLIYITYLIFIS